MRIQYFAPGDEAETGYLLGQFAVMDEFWKQFKRVCSQPETQWLEGLRAHLAQIDPGLGLEVSHEAEGLRTLYVLPLERGTGLQVARAFVERAPKVWPWAFAVFRPALALSRALTIVRQDFQLDLSQARARVGVGRGHLLEIVIGSHLFASSADELALDAADRLVNALLGDELCEEWVDCVHVSHAPRPGPLRVVGQEDTTLTLTLTELAPAVAAARRGIVAGLPEAPYHAFCEHAEWVLFEIEELRKNQAEEADTADAGVPLPQQDLVMTTTMCPEMLRCFLSGSPFSSARFSRHGERFCYLKLTLRGDSADERVAQRIAIEEMLDHLLVPGRLGCVVGSGIGTQFMYIHLSLQNVEAALPVISRRLRESGAQRASWLLFCDTELAGEWVGIWDDSPAPHWPSTHSSAFLDAYN
jgi:hypothetical protein